MLAGSHSGWLQQELVESRRIATAVQAQATFPGGRYPHLFTLAVSIAPGHSAQENETAISTVMARLHTQPVDAATLARAKAQTRANALRRMNDNAGIAHLLVSEGEPSFRRTPIDVERAVAETRRSGWPHAPGFVDENLLVAISRDEAIAQLESRRA